MNPKTHLSAIALALLTLASTSALADSDAGKFYLGAGLGSAGHRLDCSGIESCSKSDLGFKLMAGYQVTPHFAVEAAYADLGKAKRSGEGLEASLKTRSFTLAALGIMPVSKEAQVFAKLGTHFSKTRLKASYDGVHESGSDNGNGLLLGLGAQYQFTANLKGRLEYEWLNKAIRVGSERGDINLITASLLYQF
ncbi:MAG: outer membrane beta-barrel protein [Noviherbaspirillum sp.]